MPFFINNKKHRIMYCLIFFVIILTIAVISFINQPKFGRAPRGERLERIRQSPNYRDGRFRNIHITPQLTSDKGRAQVMLNFLFEKREGTRPDEVLPVTKTDLHTLDRNRDFLIWFGHSSCLLQTDGKRILVDPVFEEASPVSFFNKPFKGTDLYKPEDMPEIDYLIITHDHWDHLDYRTVRKLKDRTGRVICPLGVGEHFEYWGFAKEKITELDWNESWTSGNGFVIHCLPARHFSGRSFTANQTLWASFLVETASRKTFFSGDGGYDSHFRDIAARFPDIDIAIMENGQYNKDWRYIHLMPDDLLQAITDLHAGKILTVHHSKYALAKHPWDEPQKNIISAARKESINLLSPMIGEPMFLDR